MKKKKTSLFADVLQTVSRYFLILVVIMVVYILCSGIRIIDSGNVALILRFGKLVGNTHEEQVHGPGLLLAFPDFIDEVVVIPSGNVMQQTVETHFTPAEKETSGRGGYLITGDQNIAVASASVKYVVSDPVNYALNINNISDIINAAVSTAMVNESARMDVDQLLTDGKDAYGDAVLKFASGKLDRLHAGVTITSLELTQVSMPSEVKTLYDDVNSATVQSQTIMEQAKQYRENLLPDAEAKANLMIAEAEGIYASTIADANAKMAAFWGHLDEFKANEDVVKIRIFNEKVREMMDKIGKVHIVHDGETHIILDP